MITRCPAARTGPEYPQGRRVSSTQVVSAFSCGCGTGDGSAMLHNCVTVPVDFNKGLRLFSARGGEVTGNLGPVLRPDRHPALRSGAGLRPRWDGPLPTPRRPGQARTGSLDRTPSASDKTIRSPRTRITGPQPRTARNTTATTPSRPTPSFSDDRSSRRSRGALPHRPVASSSAPRPGRTAPRPPGTGPALPLLFSSSLARLQRAPAEPHPGRRSSGLPPSNASSSRGAP